MSRAVIGAVRGALPETKKEGWKVLELGTKGIATIAVAIVVVATAGGVSTPVVVDQVDTLPDSPFYGLERIGEGIKETFTGGQNFDISIADERIQEFSAMEGRGKAMKYLSLVDEAADRIGSAVARATDNRKLDRALDAVSRHTTVLENLIEQVPENARAALALAIYRSARGAEVLSELSAGKVNSKQLRARVQELKQAAENFKSQIEELPVWQAIQKVEQSAVDNILDKIVEVASQVDSDVCERVVAIMENRLLKLVEWTENSGLNEAEQMVLKHLDVLENVYEQVPEEAKPAIELAIARSSRMVEVLTAVKAGEISVGQLGEEVRSTAQELEELASEVKENIAKGLSVAQAVLSVNLHALDKAMEKIQQLEETLPDNVLPAVAQRLIYRYTQRVSSEEMLQNAIQLCEQYLNTVENLNLGELEESIENTLSDLEDIQSSWESGEITNISQQINQEMQQTIEQAKTTLQQWWK